MPRVHRQSRLRSALRSRAITLSLIVVAGGLSLAVGRELARRVSVQRELERLTKDITGAEQSTKELQQLIATLKSTTYQEGAARTRLNLQKPGEKVLVIPDLAPTGSAVNSEQGSSRTSEPEPTPVSNTHRWWDFLFNPKSS